MNKYILMHKNIEVALMDLDENDRNAKLIKQKILLIQIKSKRTLEKKGSFFYFYHTIIVQIKLNEKVEICVSLERRHSNVQSRMVRYGWRN